MERIKDAQGDIQDPVELAIFQSSIHSIAEEMGAALRRTSISPNVKERRDYSRALCDGRERGVSMRGHMRVHLGARPMPVTPRRGYVGLRRRERALCIGP